MENQLKNDFEKIITTSNFSSKDINIKKNYLNEFIKTILLCSNPLTKIEESILFGNE